MADADKTSGMSTKKKLLIILVFGVLLRASVFAYQRPFNLDRHIDAIKYIFENHRIPVAHTVGQSDHPPLYYVLAAMIYPLGHKAIQFFSLTLSIATLYTIYRLILGLDFIQPAYVKIHCMLLASTLPQFIMISNYVSNDSLSFLLGTLLFSTIWRYIRNPSLKNLVLMAVCEGLGLLTKGAFLSFAPSLIFLILFVESWKKGGVGAAIKPLATFAVIILVLGSFKGMQNMAYHNRIVVMNNELEPAWMEDQRPTYIGLSTFYDINVLKLWSSPTLGEKTRHSFPLLFYSSFWYNYFPIESNFRGGLSGYGFVGGVIYLLAIAPTLTILYGAATLIQLKKPDFSGVGLDRRLFEGLSLSMLISILIPVIHLALKYDIWSWANSRYLMTALFAIILVLNAGLRSIRERNPLLEKIILSVMTLLYLMFIAYYVIEISLVA